METIKLCPNYDGNEVTFLVADLNYKKSKTPKFVICEIFEGDSYLKHDIKVLWIESSEKAGNALGNTDISYWVLVKRFNNIIYLDITGLPWDDFVDERSKKIVNNLGYSIENPNNYYKNSNLLFITIATKISELNPEFQVSQINNLGKTGNIIFITK